MPREARKLSETNIYHVMLRGVNRQNIFEDDEDRRHFMVVLGRCKAVSEFRLFAFALMSNHVHLLLEPAGEPLETIFRRVGTRYAVWYNRKYERAGHLFQGRYRSENVETDLYFMTVLRYILQNPVKAGMVSHPGDYRWSSYLAYEKGKGSITDTQYACDLYGGRETLVEYLIRENDDIVMDEESFDWRLRDDQAKEVMEKITGCANTAAFQRLDPTVRKESTVKLYHERLSMGQIARLTGISKATVSRIIHKAEEQADEDDGWILREEETTEFVFADDIIW